MNGKTSAAMRSGLSFDYINPKPDQFTVDDIAIGLARECRFNGQTREHYSVAQHSVIVSLMVPKELALAALFHDGSEATMRDISSPLKSELTRYRSMENMAQAAIHEHVGLPPVIPYEQKLLIKSADTRIFATEREQMMPPSDEVWPSLRGVVPFDFKIHPMGERQAYHYFFDRYVSILRDRPFVKERGLWQAQHDEWVSRHSVPEDVQATFARPKAA